MIQVSPRINVVEFSILNIIVLFILLLILTTKTGSLKQYKLPYKIKLYNDNILLVSRNKYFLIPDHVTTKIFLYDAANLTKLNNYNNFNITIAKKIPKIFIDWKKCDGYCSDEILAAYKKMILVLQNNDNLIRNVRKIGNFVNAPIILLDNSRPLTFTVATPYKIDGRSIMTVFNLDKNFVYNQTRIQRPVNTSVLKELKNAEDVRLINLENRNIIATYTEAKLHGIRPYYKVGYMEFGINKENNSIQISKHFILPDDVVNNASFQENMQYIRSTNPDDGKINPDRFGYKNWTPFVYNRSTVYFIERLNPLHVLGLHSYQRAIDINYGLFKFEKRNAEMERISLTKRQETFWSRWGELRGGSASRPINSNEYLTFFHTTTLLPKSQRTSYFMGALTFSRNSPFIIKRISAVPIMHPSFYVGDWMRQRFDYCYYSQAFVFSYYDEKSHSTVYSNDYPFALPTNTKCGTVSKAVNITLSYGYQDKESFVAEISLCELLNSMVTVKN